MRTLASHQAGSAPTERAPEKTPKQCLIEVVDYLRTRGLAADSDQAAELLQELLTIPARFSNRRVSLGTAARELGVSRRTLGRRCQKAGLPHPSRILAFGRILAAARLLRLPSRTIGQAAYAAGWPDPFSFSNAMHRFTGLRPSVARKRGLLYLAEAWLKKELIEGNAELREPKPPRCLSCGHEIEVVASEDGDARSKQLHIW